MDKNTLIAIGLSAAILIVWNVLFPPPPPQQAPEPVAEEEQVVVSRSQESHEESVETAETLPSSLNDVPKVSESLLSREVVVETSKYVLVLDTRGAMAKSFKLKQFNHTKPRLTLSTWFPFLESILGPDFNNTDQGENLVEMFGGQIEDVRPFKIEFEDFPKANQLLSGTVYSSDQEEIMLLEDGETAILKFTSPVVEGLQLIKTFRFEANNYLIGYKVEVINRSDQPQPLKIRHYFGETRIADSQRFQQIAHEGPVYFMDESLETISSDDVSAEEWEVSRNMHWLGVEDQYFISAATALTPLRYGFFGSEQRVRKGERYFVPYYGARLPKVQLESQRMVESEFELFIGPKQEEELLKFGRNLKQSHDMTLVVLAAPLLDLLRWLYKYIGNYGVAIIILTIIVRLVLFPLTLKGMKSMKRMQQLAPRMKKLQEKYKNNKEKLNQEMMAMYRKNKVNPLGGCLPMLLQLPVFFALYSSLSSAVELRHAPFLFWINDLSQPDGLGITPLLMGVSMFFQQKLTPQSAMMDPTQAKIMQMLPIIFTFFTFTFPAGLTIYWLTSNCLSILQQQVINRIKTPELQD